MKENLDEKIACLTESNINDRFSHQQGQEEIGRPSVFSLSQEEMISEKLNNCKIKSVALRLTDEYADQFTSKSRTMPVVSGLHETENLDWIININYIVKCAKIKLDISRQSIEVIEKDLRAQAKG